MSVRGELQAIYDHNGSLTPDLVVETATPADHPLHHRFMWDDTEAAHRYRLVQAGSLIRSVKVTYREHANGDVDRVRAFVSVSPAEPEPLPNEDTPRVNPHAQYVPVAVAMGNPDTADKVLEDFERAVKSLRRQYGHLRTFREVVERELLDEAG